MCKLLRVYPVSLTGSLMLTEKILVERAKEKIRHLATVILSTTAAALVLILCILYTAIQWKE